MNVLVTGVAGYIGRHLATYLSSTGFKVFGIDKLEFPEKLSISIEREGYFRADLSQIEQNQLIKILEKFDSIVL